MLTYPVFCSRKVGNCIFKKVQVQITNKTTVRNEWKLNSADCNQIILQTLVNKSIIYHQQDQILMQKTYNLDKYKHTIVFFLNFRLLPLSFRFISLQSKRYTYDDVLIIGLCESTNKWNLSMLRFLVNVNYFLARSPSALQQIHILRNWNY